MTQSTHEKSMQDILEKLRDPSNNDPAALYTQIEKLRALLADALAKSGTIDGKTRDLVIAARKSIGGYDGEWNDDFGVSMAWLDKALEPFSSLIPYADEPDAPEFLPRSIDARGWYIGDDAMGYRFLATMYPLASGFEDVAREWGWSVHRRPAAGEWGFSLFVTRSEASANEAERRKAAENGFLVGCGHTDNMAAPLKFDADSPLPFGEVPKIFPGWGAPITIDGRRPDWLNDDDPISLTSLLGTELSLGIPVGTHMRVKDLNWSDTALGNSLAYLYADHPYYLATSRGFTYWQGGDVAPADWDGGDVLLRDGGICARKLVTDWGPIPIAPLIEIIGYHRKVETIPEFAEVCSCPEGGWSEDCLEHPLPPTIPDNAFDDMENSALKAMLSSHRRAQRDAFAMAAAPFILGKFFGAVDYGDLVVHLFDFADSCIAESEKRAKGDAA